MLRVEWGELFGRKQAEWFPAWQEALLREHGSYLSPLRPRFGVSGDHYLVKHTPVGNLAFGVCPGDLRGRLRENTEERRLALSASYSALAGWHVMVYPDALDLLHTQAEEPLVRKAVATSELPPEMALTKLGRTGDYATRLAFPDLAARVVEELGTLKVNLARYTRRANGAIHDLLNALVLFRFLEDRLQHAGSTVLDLFDQYRGERPLKVVRKLADTHCLDEQALSPIISLSRLAELGPDATSVVADMAAALYGGRGAAGYTLDFNLLTTHALGPLYDKYIAEIAWHTDPQTSLFGERPAELTAARAAGAHYTPEPLARALLREALSALPPSDWAHLKVADLACGSGVFLSLFLQELGEGGHAITSRTLGNLFGYDLLDAAVTSAKLCVGLTAYTLAGEIVPGFQPCRHDTLDSYVEQPDSFHERFDVVLMNPPFKGYQEQSEVERAKVRGVLGTLGRYQPDMSYAFLRAAMDSVRPGGVLGILLPRAFLDAGSSAPLRRQLDEEWAIQALSVFEQYTLFSRGEVSIAALVAKKALPATRVQKGRAKVLMCRSDMPAGVLAWERGQFARSPQWDVFRSDPYHWGTVWRPLPEDTQATFARLQSAHEKVADLFSICRGIYTGAKEVFVVPDFRQFPEDERHLLKPVADDDNISSWRIRTDDRRLIYAYTREGPLAPEEIEEQAPTIYQHLTAHERQLRQRVTLREKSLGELARHRLKNWMFVSKIACPYFGLAGCFAFDEEGTYAVTNGHYLLPGSGYLDEDQWYYYLGVLNSPLFFRLLATASPRLKGSQYRLDRKYVADLPLPSFDTVGVSTRETIVAYAELAMRGTIAPEQMKELHRGVADAYGLSDPELAVLGLSQRAEST